MKQAPGMVDRLISVALIEIRFENIEELVIGSKAMRLPVKLGQTS